MFEREEREESRAMEDMRIELAGKKKALEAAYTTLKDAGKDTADYGLLQTYVREVSQFHRQFLIPLVGVVTQILEQADKIADEDGKAKLAQVIKFVKAIEDRSKHYESQALVEKARKQAEDELKRMTVKTGLSGETGAVKVNMTTGELAAGTHASHCAKAHDHSKRCDCHLASNYPPP